MKNKEKKPDLRPWFKKKRFIIPLAWVAVSVLIVIFNPKENESSENNDVKKSEVSSKVDTVSEKVEDKNAIFKNRLNAEITGLTVDKDVISAANPDINDVRLAVSTIKESIDIYKKGINNSDPEIKKMAQSLKPLIIEMQKVSYPKMRKAYFEFAKKTLWEHDVNVKLEGKKNTVLIFTGAHFAANKNIKETQETLSDMLHTLRFKEAHYEWYKDQDDRNYYDMKTPKDDELVID
jgi:prefoldin subunit 5